jgi:hypothetical protein
MRPFAHPSGVSSNCCNRAASSGGRRATPRGKLRRQARDPSGVDQPKLDQVSQVHAIFIAKRDQLHLHKRCQVERAKVADLCELIDVGRFQYMIAADFLVGKDDMDGVARRGLGSVEEHGHTE